eukprot:Gb_13432 [translate_table: standard]
MNQDHQLHSNRPENVVPEQPKASCDQNHHVCNAHDGHESLQGGVMRSVGDIISSSTVTVKEVVLSKVSVSKPIERDEMQGFIRESATPKGKAELKEMKTCEEADKGMIESMGEILSPTVIHVKQVFMNKVADAAAHGPETEEASLLINSIIRD